MSKVNRVSGQHTVLWRIMPIQFGSPYGRTWLFVVHWEKTTEVCKG